MDSATQRKELRDRHLTTVIAASEDAIVGKTLEGIVISWNPGAERLFGYSADEAIGQPLAQLIIPPDLQDEETNLLARLRLGHRIDHHRTHRLCKDGQRIAIVLTLVPIRDEQGRILGVSTIARLEPGSRHVEFQAKLHDFTQRCRHLDAFFEHAIMPLALLDRDFRLIRVNPAYAQTWRKSVDDFVGHNQFEFYPAALRPLFEMVVHSGQPYQAHARPFVFPDQPERGVSYWDWLLTPLLNDQGEVEALALALEDVTHTQKAEQELEQYRQHLESRVREQTQALETTNAQLQQDITQRAQAERQHRELESTLTRIVATAPGVICAFQMWPDGRVCFPYASPGIEAFYSLTPAQLAEDAAPIFDLVHPDDVGHVHATIAESARTLTLWRDEWRIRHPTKGDMWIEGRSMPELEPDGSILWYGFIHDISERKRTEEALREADRRKNEFLAMLGHELRNPLAPMRNAIKLMNRLTPDDPRQLWARDMVMRQMNHIVRLVDDLLDVSRIVQGKLILQKTTLDIASVVNQAVETSLPLLETRHHQLTVTQAEQPVRVEGDGLRLAQVIGNLLNNAAKYTPDGGQVWLTVRPEDGEVAIAVRDSGEGIPPQLLPYIFELFTQADRTLNRAQGGLGLGLTIVRNIVAMHGGRVEAHSAGPGQGSEFVVRLPVLEDGDHSPQGQGNRAMCGPPRRSAGIGNHH